MTRVAMRVLVLLGYLVGCAEAMDGEAAGRYSLELVGFVVAAFLLYVAFSGVIMAVFSRPRPQMKRLVKHRGVSEVASAAARSGHDSRGSREGRP